MFAAESVWRKRAMRGTGYSHAGSDDAGSRPMLELIGSFFCGGLGK